MASLSAVPFLTHICIRRLPASVYGAKGHCAEEGIPTDRVSFSHEVTLGRKENCKRIKRVMGAEMEKIKTEKSGKAM